MSDKPHRAEPIKIEEGKLYINVNLEEIRKGNWAVGEATCLGPLRAGEYALLERSIDLGFLRGDAQIGPFQAAVDGLKSIADIAAGIRMRSIELTTGCIRLTKGSFERLFRNRRYRREMAWHRKLNTTMRRYRRKQAKLKEEK